MRVPKILVAVVLLLALVVAIYTIHLIRRGLSASGEPSLLEKSVARAARNLAIPSSARNQPNPLQPTPGSLAEGSRHFADHCSVCHANNGSGETEMGRNLYPKPPDMRLSETQNLTDAEIFYIIQNGVRLTGMPAWGGSHHADDTWKLVLFIRHLPHLTDAEETDMERFNPKSEADYQEEQEEQDFLNGTSTSTSSNKK